MNKSVSIVGMGWLGQPLAIHLDDLGYNIRGSVMTLEKATQLQQRGFDAFRIVVSDDGVHGRINILLKNTSCAILMIPPGLRRDTGANYFQKMEHLYTELKRFKVPKVILVSSISVYDDSQGKVTESDNPKPQNTTAKQLWETEEMFINSTDFQTTVVRFGGMFSGSRQPLRFLVGRKNLAGGQAPVNLIHRDDCIHIISKIIEKDAFGHIFNAVHPEHPTKAEYFIASAKKAGLDPPSFKNHYSTETYKQVDSNNLEKILNYQFKRPL